MKARKKYYSLSSFVSYLGRYKLGLAVVMTSFVLSDILISIIPIFIGKLVGALATQPVQGHQAVIYVWLLIGCSTGHNLLWRASELLFLKFLNPVSFNYENILFKKIIDKPYPYFVDKFTGKMSSYIRTISQEMHDLLDNLCFNYTSQVVGLIIITAILVSINWQTGVVFLCGIVAMFLVGRHTIRNSTHYEKISTDVQSTKNAKIIDAIANFVNVKSFHKEELEVRAIKMEQTKAVKASNKSYLWAVIFWGSLSFFVRDLIWPVTIGLNVYFFLHHQKTIAQLATLLSTVLLFSTTIWEIIWNVSQFNLRLARIEEAHHYLFGDVNVVREYFEEQDRVREERELSEELALKGLSFAYPDKKNTVVLNDISLTIKKGQKVGIVGKSGSGKTTLTKLLLGYYPELGGEVLLDNQTVDTRDLARLISYVPQDTSLFHRSVADNIAYATDKTVSREQIVQAAKAAHADEFISQISDGYEALVGERGIKLSAGQRQRIAIARAFLDDKPILILDEATSALDSESEILVQQALENLWQHKTVIAIAHRLSTLRHMDIIVVMDKGKIVEQGSHAELLAKRGIYAKLWNHQSGGFIEE
jgi:ATP-binding cassette subfamily B protein